jgi:hypothetical protein
MEEIDFLINLLNTKKNADLKPKYSENTIPSLPCIGLAKKVKPDVVLKKTKILLTNFNKIITTKKKKVINKTQYHVY